MDRLAAAVRMAAKQLACLLSVKVFFPALLITGSLARKQPDSAAAYNAKYRQQSVQVRDTITFSSQLGGAALLDFHRWSTTARS
jgi:GTP-dependent phosphoenolpyruvate carboxykinase